MAKETVNQPKWTGPFTTRIDAPKQGNFDKYYFELEKKIIAIPSGKKDEEGNDICATKVKYNQKKIDICELIESQRDTVGVSSYIKQLGIQGINIDECKTVVDDSNVQDFSNMPDTLVEVMTAGDKAKEAFKNMDPALRGNHTTIDGFLNSLSQEVLDNYIKGRVDALMPKQVVKEKEGN